MMNYINENINKDKRHMKVLNGCEAAAYVSYAFIDVCVVYPITPSTSMSEYAEKLIINRAKNIFGQVPLFFESQSESGSAGILHGILTSGAFCTSYTSSQGLLLMLPVLYKIAGEFLPLVLHVASRTVARHALSIFGDHSDIYACRQTGILIFCSANVQEVNDLAALSHIVAIMARIPIIHFFDGFRTSHEVSKIKIWDYKDLHELIDENAIKIFRNSSINPSRSIIRGTNQNDDVYFQFLEAGNKRYEEINKIIISQMNKINMKIGTFYKHFSYYGDVNAKIIIVAMGSVCGNIEEIVDFINENKTIINVKVGFIKVTIYRPFISSLFVKEIPKSVEKISVIDRTKEPGSAGEPLFLDVIAALNEINIKNIEVFRGRYGISSKDTDKNNIFSIFKNMDCYNTKKHFTIGINDDVTKLSLENYKIDIPDKSTNIEIWGLGSDGAVSASKSSLKIIGENTDLFIQGYFKYDSKKSGGLTVSYLKFDKTAIKSSCYIEKTDFFVCQHFEFVNLYDFSNKLKKDSIFLLNSPFDECKTLELINVKLIEFIYNNNISFFIINATYIKDQLKSIKINMPIQSAFFKILNIIPFEKSKELIKKYIHKNYSSKGDKSVYENCLAVDLAPENLKKISKILIKNFLNNIKNKNLKIILDKNNKEELKSKNNFYNIINKINSNNGYLLPVSDFLKFSDGSIPNSTSLLAFRCKAQNIPCWEAKNCSECGLCSLLCPHGVIRSFCLNDEEIVKLKSFLVEQNIDYPIEHKKMFGFENLNFLVIFSYEQCTGCGICAKICPGLLKKCAIKMKNIDNNLNKHIYNCEKIIDFCKNFNEKTEIYNKFKEDTTRGIQFKEPLLKYGDSCAGCGQGAYVRLLTQMFGTHLYIANATGCSSIWGGSLINPYYKGKHGFSPAWHNSLFENNAEFGLGFVFSNNSIRIRLFDTIKKIIDLENDQNLKNILNRYLETFNENSNFEVSAKLIEILEEKLKKSENNELYLLYQKIISEKEYLSKKSIWCVGGDGWAYDIGFGGIDHVIASGQNINMLVLDTEMYSNTGGQVSKSTPKGALALLALGNNKNNKKDLASMMMIYKNSYIAKVNIGANSHQCIKAFKEADEFNGPSLIIAYAPCIGHGIKCGMKNSCNQAKLATECGYWNLFRYNPNLSDPFIKDSNCSESLYKDFIYSERRFETLNKLL